MLKLLILGYWILGLDGNGDVISRMKIIKEEVGFMVKWLEFVCFVLAV